jgi:hypothetical protein
LASFKNATKRIHLGAGTTIWCFGLFVIINNVYAIQMIAMWVLFFIEGLKETP